MVLLPASLNTICWSLKTRRKHQSVHILLCCMFSLSVLSSSSFRSQTVLCLRHQSSSSSRNSGEIRKRIPILASAAAFSSTNYISKSQRCCTTPTSASTFSSSTLYSKPPARSITSASSSPSNNKMSTLPTAATDSSAATSSEYTTPKFEMSAAEKYLFDLNGYIVVRGVLTPDEIAMANAAITDHADDMIERSDGALRNAKKDTAMYGTGPGRKDLGGVLEWGSTQSRVFQSILAHRKLVPYFHTILGKGYRMDHLPFVLVQDTGAEGFRLHGGTVDCETGEYNDYLAYKCHRDTIRCSLLGCNVMLTDHNSGDGGFCVVPGSHKSNFAMPPAMIDGGDDDVYAEFIAQPETKAGDVVLFSEGTVHGAKPWKPTNRQRRACLYRFAPATSSYGRSYFGHSTTTNDNNTTTTMGWPSKMYDGLNDAEAAVLEPPYANRLDRPNIIISDNEHDEGTCDSVEITTRNKTKRQHDTNVFGTKYF